MSFDVVINTDDNYVQHCAAMLCSLFENNNDHSIIVHILERNISLQNKEYLKRLSNRYNNDCFFYVVDESKLEGVQFRNNRPLSMAAYYRLLLASVLPMHISRVLYLDCDMIVLEDVSELFEIELDNYALAATMDSFPYSQKHRLQLHMQCGERTFCSGMMLVNLDYWRSQNSEAGLLEYAKRKREVVYLHDQDVLNYYFKGQWFLLPPKWNHVAATTICESLPEYKGFDLYEYVFCPKIIHYAAPYLKPWINWSYPQSEYYKHYLALSKFPKPVLNRINFSLRLTLLKMSILYPIKIILVRFRLRNAKSKMIS